MQHVEISEFVSHLNDSNIGTCFLRFKFKRDATRAALSMNNTEIDGKIVKIEEVLPQYWPTQKTRRYF